MVLTEVLKKLGVSSSAICQSESNSCAARWYFLVSTTTSAVDLGDTLKPISPLTPTSTCTFPSPPNEIRCFCCTLLLSLSYPSAPPPSRHPKSLQFKTSSCFSGNLYDSLTVTALLAPKSGAGCTNGSSISSSWTSVANKCGVLSD